MAQKKPPIRPTPPVRQAADGGLAPSNQFQDQMDNRRPNTGRGLPIPHTHPDPAKDPMAQAAAFAAANSGPWTEHDTRSYDDRRALFDTLHGRTASDAEPASSATATANEEASTDD